MYLSREAWQLFIQKGSYPPNIQQFLHCMDLKLRNELVILMYKTAEKVEPSETKRKADKDMNRESGKLILICGIKRLDAGDHATNN